MSVGQPDAADRKHLMTHVFRWGVLGAAITLIIWHLNQWDQIGPDLSWVCVGALLLVPVSIRFQVTVSRGSVDLAVGAAGVALFGATPPQQASTFPLWAAVMFASYAILPSTRPGKIERAAMHVVAGAAMIKASSHASFGVQPYTDVLVGMLAYIAVIAALEKVRRLSSPHRNREHLLLHLRWAYVFLVALTIYYIGVCAAVLRRLEGGQDVAVGPGLAIALFGAFAISVGFAVGHQQLQRSLQTVSEAAIAMPWSRESIYDSVRDWTQRAMRTSEVQVASQRGTRGISAPLGEGQWLLARRDAGDLPFTEVEQQVLSALASMASTSMRRADVDDHLHERASSDNLSGLPTYASFRDRLDRLSGDRDDGESLGVLFIDLDDFKSVNDTYGHLVGDQVIRAVAGRLRTFAGEDGLLTRFGGDEFALVRRHAGGLEGLQVVAAELLDVFAAPIMSAKWWSRWQQASGWRSRQAPMMIWT